MNNKSIKVTFLGTGANGGVPQLDCRCKFCAKTDVRNKRGRSSLLIECANRKILIDCGPDIRQQLLVKNLRLKDISAIIISHLHWDHSIGLVELSSGKNLKIPILVASRLKKQILSHKQFAFLFTNGFAKMCKKLDNQVKIKFLKIPHDPSFPTFAILIELGGRSVFIATDIASITQEFTKIAKEVDLVIFDGTFLQKSAHGHICIKKSAPILHQLKRLIIYTHINHSENPGEIKKFLKPLGFRLAFDGMELKV